MSAPLSSDLIVLDASAGVELLLAPEGRGGAIAERLGTVRAIHVPHLFDLEITNALRGLERSGRLTSARAGLALEALLDLRLIRHPHRPLLERAWVLRANLTAYDAVYVALAEGLDATLVTADAAVSSASGTFARIELV